MLMMVSEEQREIQAARHRLESDLTILQSDKGRLDRKQEGLFMEIKRLQNDEKRLKIVIQEKEEEKRKVDREITEIEAEIIHAKKKMNTL